MCTILKTEVDNGHPREEYNGPKLELFAEDNQQCVINDGVGQPLSNLVKLEPGLAAVDVEMVYI